MEFTEEEQKLKKKFFPRVPWTEEGPVRREYLVRAADGSGTDAGALLAKLAVEFGFCDTTVSGDAGVCRKSFADRAAGENTGLIIGTEAAAVWCDLSVCDAAEAGWQRLIVRSEQAENLTALAHEEELLRFRRAQK